MQIKHEKERELTYLPNSRGSASDYNDFIFHIFTIKGVVKPLTSTDKTQGRPCEGQHHQACRRHHPIQDRVNQIHRQKPLIFTQKCYKLKFSRERNRVVKYQNQISKEAWLWVI